MKFLVPLLILSGCGEDPIPGTCLALCEMLVDDCEYAAYPTVPSCRQGCEYNASLGADVIGEKQCIENAECDLFTILECEHTFGTPYDTGTSFP